LTSRFPPAIARGIRHFNAGRFFEAHEAFEDLLDEVEGDERWDLLVALVQVAVGYHKWTSAHSGAERMLRLGGTKLAAFPPVAYGISVDRLRERVTNDATTLAGQDPPKGPTEPPPRIDMRRAERK
jgi:uncharacterized protein